MLITVLKIIIFFMGWAICTGLGTISSDNPVIWRLGAETLPLLYILIFSMMFWLIEKRKIKIISFKKFLLNIYVGIGVGVLWLGVTVTILYLTGTISFSGSNQITYLSIWLFACFLNVSMQELLVRGYIYQMIKSKYNVITMSVFISLVLEYTGSLVAPILIHTIWNGVGAIILGGVSLADDYPHLLNLVFSGNKLLSGGDYKMEGSIVVFILNVLLSISFYFFLKKRNMDQEVLK